MVNISEIIERARYLEGGRQWPHVDCYGIVLHVRSLLGMPALPELGHARRGVNMNEIGTAQAQAMVACGPEDGVVAACYDGAGLMIHTGVCYAGEVIECNPRRNASRVLVHKFIKRFHRVEFYK